MPYTLSILVIPAQAGIQVMQLFWLPAFAGMTKQRTFIMQFWLVEEFTKESIIEKTYSCKNLP